MAAEAAPADVPRAEADVPRAKPAPADVPRAILPNATILGRLTAALEGVDSIRQLHAVLDRVSEQPLYGKFNGLRNAFQPAGVTEAAFFATVLPEIARRAALLPDLLPDGLPLLAQQQARVLTLRRAQVASLLACMFLCVVPEQHLPDEAFPLPSFAPLLSNAAPQECAKLQMFLHYFARIAETPAGPEGVIHFRRSVLADPEAVDFGAGAPPLRALRVLPGTIEDAGDALQVDFANMFIGGGVLCGGCVQEEIRFGINAELTASLAFCAVMAPNEALIITGAEQFSAYAGYAFGLQFGGSFADQRPVAADGTRQTAIVAIDATSFGGGGAAVQSQPQYLQRDLVKAYAGFLDVSADAECGSARFPVVATGNWGCGAFGGHLELKAVTQWIAAAKANRELQYYPFDQQAFGARLQRFADDVLARGDITAATLYRALTDAGEQLRAAREPAMHGRGLLKVMREVLGLPPDRRSGQGGSSPEEEEEGGGSDEREYGSEPDVEGLEGLSASDDDAAE